jgi:hypothetical protein
MKMKKYKLTILGYPKENPKEITTCFQMLTYGLEKEFSKLSHVNSSSHQISNYFTVNDIPLSDFIIVIGYSDFFNKNNLQILKSKCRYIFSFLEEGEPADYSFVFSDNFLKQSTDKCIIIPAPYCPEFYKQEIKEPNTILIDHFNSCLFYENILPEKKWHQVDLTREIYQWINPLANEYKIYAMYNIIRHPEITLSWIPSYITPISQTNFLDYIEFISKIETFIATARGSYNYSIVDMLVMGSRILTPPNFIVDYQTKRFNIPIFKNQEELIKEIKKPLDFIILNKNIEKCTPMNEIVKIIDKKIQEYL